MLWQTRRSSFAACAALVWGKILGFLSCQKKKTLLRFLVLTLLLWSEILWNRPLILILIMSKTKPAYSTSHVRFVPGDTSVWNVTSSSHNRSISGWWRWLPRRKRWKQSGLTEIESLDETRGQESKSIVTGFTCWSQVREGTKGLTRRLCGWNVGLFPPKSLSCWGGCGCLHNQRPFRAVQPLLSRLRAIHRHWGAQAFIQRHRLPQRNQRLPLEKQIWLFLLSRLRDVRL